jgi:RNA polymerase sigma-70 factor, ECF subfamily
MSLAKPNPTACDSTESAGTEPMDQDRLYRQVIAEHGAALARLAAGYEANIEQRRDLLQEIHVALWRSFSGFNAQCSLRTWVYRVAHNTASTHVLRDKRRKSSKLLSLDELAEMPVEQDSERQVDEAAVLERLSALIQQLNPIERDIILLYLEGIEAVEIGEISGLSPDNVAQKIHRIKKLLRRRFDAGESHV